MNYVIYNVETTRFVRIMRNGYWQDATYASQGAAKTAFTRLAKKQPNEAMNIAFTAEHAIAERGEFHAKIEKTRATCNILNPKAGEFQIPVNTPACCDPGTETYHSM